MPTWLWPVGAFLLVLAATFAPGVGAVLVAPLVALLVGGVAAWAMRDAEASLGRMAALGALAGVGALLAGIVAFALLGFGLGGDPEVQALVQASEPHPEARLPADWIAPLGAALGAFIGLGAGLVNLALAALGGLLAGLLRSGAGAPRLGAQPR